MNLRWLNFIFLAMIALSACGSGPEQPAMDRRFLAGEYLETAKSNLLAGVKGEVLDHHEWIFGGQKVFTILSREREPDTGFTGIFVRQYDLSGQSAKHLWTYQDSVGCLVDEAGGAAGAGYMDNHSPALRPVKLVAGEPEQFLLSYALGCTAADAFRNVVVVDALSGTPSVRLSGAAGNVAEAEGLHQLTPADRERLVAMLNG